MSISTAHLDQYLVESSAGPSSSWSRYNETEAPSSSPNLPLSDLERAPRFASRERLKKTSERAKWSPKSGSRMPSQDRDEGKLADGPLPSNDAEGILAEMPRIGSGTGLDMEGTSQRLRKTSAQYSQDEDKEDVTHSFPPRQPRQIYTGTDPFRLSGRRVPPSTIAALKQKRGQVPSSPEAALPNDKLRHSTSSKGAYTMSKRQAFLGFFSRLGTGSGRRQARLGEFYEEQNELIDSLLRPVGNAREDDQRMKEEAEAERRKWQVKIAVNGSLAVNIILFMLQLTAAIISKSLSLYATTADSFMDLLSSLILAAANRMKVRANWNKYPTGKGRIETTAIITFASLMGTVSVQLIIESIRTFVSSDHSSPDVTTLPIIFVSLALASKGCLFIYCFALRAYPSARVLAQDHRNDLVVNSFGLLTSLLGGHIGWFFDPMGAMIIALFILFSWSRTAWEHIQLIIGKTADSSFLQRITYIAVTHSNKVLQVDTCRAYHQGEKLYVEVDIVMDRNTPLWETHDCGEELQIKLESLSEVERAFVHVDYETLHAPEHRKEQ